MNQSRVYTIKHPQVKSQATFKALPVRNSLRRVKPLDCYQVHN